MPRKKYKWEWERNTSHHRLRPGQIIKLESETVAVVKSVLTVSV